MSAPLLTQPPRSARPVAMVLAERLIDVLLKAAADGFVTLDWIRETVAMMPPVLQGEDRDAMEMLIRSASEHFSDEELDQLVANLDQVVDAYRRRLRSS